MTRNLNMFTLIAMDTGVAYVYSLIGTIAPGIFPATFRGHGGAVAVYFEAAAVITVLVLLGQVLELRAREATSGAIMRSQGVNTSALEAEAELQRGEGATVINMAVDGKLAGILAIADPVKQSTPEALRLLASEGVKVIMLTGDNRTTAQAVAHKLDIADVEAEVLPDWPGVRCRSSDRGEPTRRCRGQTGTARPDRG